MRYSHPYTDVNNLSIFLLPSSLSVYLYLPLCLLFSISAFLSLSHFLPLSLCPFSPFPTLSRLSICFFSPFINGFFSSHLSLPLSPDLSPSFFPRLMLSLISYLSAALLTKTNITRPSLALLRPLINPFSPALSASFSFFSLFSLFALFSLSLSPWYFIFIFFPFLSCVLFCFSLSI